MAGASGVRVRREPCGVWSCRLYLGRDALGNPIRPYCSFPAAGSEQEAQELAETWAANLTANGSLRTAKLCALLDEYATMRERNGASPNSVRSYRLFAGYVRRFMPRVDARKATVMDLNRFEQKLLSPAEEGGAGLSRNTVLAVHNFLRGAYNHFVDAGICTANPMVFVAKPSPEHHEAEVVSEWDFDRLAGMLAAEMEGMDGTKGGIHRASCAFAAWLSLMTGMRVGEVCALRRRDVDAARGMLHVGGTVMEAAGRKPYRRDVTKGRKCRNVSVTDSALSAVLAWTRRQDALLGRLPASAPLVTADGGFMRPGTVSTGFSRIRDECGLPRSVTFHSLRHTHASWLIANGCDIKTVSERLGHADVATTLRVYAHLMPGRDAAAAETFEKTAERLSGGAFASVPKACQEGSADGAAPTGETPGGGADILRGGKPAGR